MFKPRPPPSLTPPPNQKGKQINATVPVSSWAGAFSAASCLQLFVQNEQGFVVFDDCLRLNLQITHVHPSGVHFRRVQPTATATGRHRASNAARECSCPSAAYLTKTRQVGGQRTIVVRVVMIYNSLQTCQGRGAMNDSMYLMIST